MLCSLRHLQSSAQCVLNFYTPTKGKTTKGEFLVLQTVITYMWLNPAVGVQFHFRIQTAMSGKDFERLFQDFEARAEYLKCSHAAASSASGSRVELSQKVIDQFVAGLGGMSLNASRAQRLFTLISGSPFDEGQRPSVFINSYFVIYVRFVLLS